MTRARVVFIGKEGIFSMHTLRQLAERHELAGIVESLPRNFGSFNEGRSRWSRLRHRLFDDRDANQSLLRKANRSKLPYLALTKANSSSLAPFLNRLRPDLVVVAALSQVLRENVLMIPRQGFVNVHPSLLPAYRGPNPWFWQCFFGEKVGGVTIHRMDKGSDTGNILAQGRYEIPSGALFSDVLARAAVVAGNLISDAVEQALSGDPGEPQKHLKAPFYARRVRSDENILDWQTWPIERT